MQVRVLGPIEIAGDDGPVGLAATMHRRLLAALVIAAGETCSRDELIDALWGQSPPASASKLLQVYVSQLRKVLPAPARIETRGGGYSLELDDGRSLDAARFERLLDDGREALESNSALAMSLFTKALELWRGPAYAEFAYEDFARVEVERLEELRRVAIEERNEAALALGRHEELLAELTSAARAQPLRERVQGQAMLALYRCGRQSEALELYADTRARLDEELGLEPGPELRELQRRILQQDPALSSATREGVASELPAAPNALLGRDRELRELRELLVRDDLRLLVLSGPGGVGKTRLALEAARKAASSFANGAVFVSLAPLRDPELVLGEISRALGVRQEAGAEPLGTLVAALRAKELLLVLDNAEHLRPATPLFVDLIAGAPRLTLLVTSRVVLHLSGERVYPLEPLGEDAAAALFDERARDGSPHFTPDAEDEEAIRLICERLDGLPLAIELAASRIRALSPAELLERLDLRLPLLTGGLRDLPARQQTLRATLDWAVDLLGEDELQDLMRLAIFAGGCTLEAAEAVAGTTVERLSSLIDHSLIRHESTAAGSRYSMLEMIREYAVERMEALGEAEAVRRRHAEFYAALAAQLEPELDRGRYDPLDRVETELDNFHAALGWALAADGELALRLAASLRAFWVPAFRLREARLWLGRALAGSHPPSYELAAVATELARINLLLGEHAAAEEVIDQALELAEALELPDVLSIALVQRAALLTRLGRNDEALETNERALAMAREHELDGPLMRALYNLSYLLSDWDKVAECDLNEREGLELARARGDQGFERRFLFNVVWGATWLGEWAEAVERAEAGYGKRDRDLTLLTPLPWVFVQRGELDEARRTLELLAPLAVRDGTQPRALEALARAVVRRAEGRPQEALAAAEEILAKRSGLGARHGWLKYGFVEAVEAAFALDDLDRVAELLDEWERGSAELRTPFIEAHERRFAARLAARRGESAAVEPSFLRSAELFREVSHPFYVAVALVEHGEWLTGRDRSAAAEPLIAEAREIFERLGAAPWLERASHSVAG